MKVPDDLHYAESHEWLRPDGTVGISDHAQAELTDVVYVELPQIGKAVNAGEPVCVVESVKAASDIFAPASGTVAAVNEDLRTNPALVNTDPFGAGWIFRLFMEPGAGMGNLKTPAQYREQLGSA